MPPNEIGFDAEDRAIREVLFGDEEFRIPRYQRPYAWTEDQISEFWNDVTGSNKNLFIGSFIFNYETVNDNGYVEVVDGQQRLLSITIFSAVLRDSSKVVDDELSRRIQRQDIAFENRQGEYKYRIKCGDSTQEFFEKNIQDYENDILNSIPKTKEEIRIKKNYEYLLKKVEQELKRFETKGEKVNYIESLRKKIEDLLVIKVKIDSEDDAYEIFETTNARGVDLSVADLLKNAIFKQIREKDKKDFAKDVWQEIEANILATNTELKKFLRYFWISKYEYISDKNLFRAVKKEITDWELFLYELRDASVWFNLLIEGNEQDWNVLNTDQKKIGTRIYQSIQALRWMNVTQCYIFFLSILRNIKKLETNPSDIFSTIEKFTFNYSVVSKMPGNVVEKIYSGYAQKIQHTIDKESPGKIGGKIQSILGELKPSYEKSDLPLKYLLLHMRIYHMIIIRKNPVL